jgi:hypothetical protein
VCAYVILASDLHECTNVCAMAYVYACFSLPPPFQLTCDKREELGEMILSSGMGFVLVLLNCMMSAGGNVYTYVCDAVLFLFVFWFWFFNSHLSPLSSCLCWWCPSLLSESGC